VRISRYDLELVSTGREKKAVWNAPERNVEGKEKEKEGEKRRGRASTF